MFSKSLRALSCALPFVLLSLVPLTAQAASYISDELFVYMHSGPTNKYRIIATANAGESIDILERNNDSGYVKIKTERGKTGWVVGEYITQAPVARDRLPQLEQELAQAKQSQTLAEQREADLQTRLDNLEQQRQEEVSVLEQEKQQLEAQLTKLNGERNQLQNSIDKMDETLLMQWFMKGSLVMAGGIILGLILPLFFRRRKASAGGWA